MYSVTSLFASGDSVPYDITICFFPEDIGVSNKEILPSSPLIIIADDFNYSGCQICFQLLKTSGLL